MAKKNLYQTNIFGDEGTNLSYAGYKMLYSEKARDLYTSGIFGDEKNNNNIVHADDGNVYHKMIYLNDAIKIYYLWKNELSDINKKSFIDEVVNIDISKQKESHLIINFHQKLKIAIPSNKEWFEIVIVYAIYKISEHLHSKGFKQWERIIDKNKGRSKPDMISYKNGKCIPLEIKSTKNDSVFYREKQINFHKEQCDSKTCKLVTVSPLTIASFIESNFEKFDRIIKDI